MDGGKCFLPFKIVTILGKRASQKTKLPRWTSWSVKLSTLPGGNALICAVDVAMSVESV